MSVSASSSRSTRADSVTSCALVMPACVRNSRNQSASKSRARSTPSAITRTS
eukprot:CAMPEP_0172194814 /NCGR_PEP_ID=MMETSP1050-20130122/25823_1 /TAXON_ID=233186 /ORGANISM="Cryptomonas curvata, Strain CCAP979/52" /LENGTH=51 /DNA_ID=CAMNT_0012870731 /DNA_START=258 /DNA_END=410 /DNA_ORIENTATION=+